MLGFNKNFHLLLALLYLFLEPSNCIEDLSGHRNLALIPTDICGPVFPDTRIAGGREVYLFEMPWMAMLIKRKRGNRRIFVCGGSLINERYVLTAAHCIGRTYPNLVRLGATVNTDLRNSPEKTHLNPLAQEIEIEKKIQHPHFSVEPDIINDIALLRLATKADYRSGAVLPICLPFGIFGDNRKLIGRRATAAGWGRTQTGRHSVELLKTTLSIKDISGCRGGSLSAEAQICAGGDRGADTCNGDSGGPLTLDELVQGKLKTVQIGITSFGGLICGSTGYPSIYTNVGHYLKWILDNIEP